MAGPNDEKKPGDANEFTFPDESAQAAAVAAGESDIEIAVVPDDVPPEDRGRQIGASKAVADVTDEELQAHSEGVQKRFKELSFARHDERRAKEQALRERDELLQRTKAAIEENRRLREYVDNGVKAYAGTKKEAAEAKLENAKRKYKEAHEAFDADALIAAQQELTDAQLELAAAKNFKAPPLQEEKPGYDAPTESAPLDPRVVEWQQRNNWFGRDRRLTAYALALHEDLVNSGVDPRSKEYFERIDADMRSTFPAQFKPAETPPERAQPPQRRAESVVAPTARSTAGKTKVALTETQVALAKRLGVPLEEYARQVALQEAGNGR